MPSHTGTYTELHVGEYKRRRLGRGALSNRPLYGTHVRCTCGWEYRSNGTRREAEQAFREHVRETKESFTIRSGGLRAAPLHAFPSDEDLRALGNLLAVLNGDGGQHIDAVGWEQAAKDAEATFHALQQRVAEGHLISEATRIAIRLAGREWARDDPDEGEDTFMNAIGIMFAQCRADGLLGD